LSTELTTIVGFMQAMEFLVERPAPARLDAGGNTGEKAPAL
jgi:hypothetical protein